MDMKKYIGTKTVSATPMTRGEAYDNNLLKKDAVPTETERDDRGYKVRYEGGYESWSPAETFEKAYRLAETDVDKLLIKMGHVCNEQEEIKKKFVDETTAIAIAGNPKYEFLLNCENVICDEARKIIEGRIQMAEGNNSDFAYNELSFGQVIVALECGLAIRRHGWNGKGLLVVKQVPAHITGEVITNMQSLPKSAKEILMKRENPHIDYTNQMLIINPDGRADSWVPSSSDVFAKDWEVIVEY